ncbi:Trk system potassium transport protein TrkA [Spirochaetia bacterium]|nr:Trk system potassium transport protein TrkA [Spirochaetia bacterium]
MRIVIVGAGLVGTQLARHLIQEKHDISLIESNAERARHASNRMDCLVLHDEGNSLRALEDAGIARADALVCVTGSDEVNMIICGLAASRYPKLLKIARVRNVDYARLNLQGEGALHEGTSAGGAAGSVAALGIDHFVQPDVEAARSVLNAIEHRAMGDIISFADTSYELGAIDITAGSIFDGLSLMKYRTLIPGESLVTLVERVNSDTVESILPTGATVLAKGDRVHILAKEGEIDNIFRLAGRSEKPLRKIGIVGGGRVGTLIAEGLLEKPAQSGAGKKSLRSIFSRLKIFIPKRGNRVVIIEQDYSLCKDLAARFPDALILNEDISDEGFIAEDRINDLDLIVTTTAQQELNIITAVYLKSRGVARTIALVTGAGYASIARQLGVDVVIPMKSVVVDSILSCLVGGGVTGVHRLGDGSINILELETGTNAPAADKALKDCRFPAGSLVMLVNRDGASFIPQGNHVIKAGDRIVMIAKNGNEAEIGRIFNAAENDSGSASVKSDTAP